MSVQAAMNQLIGTTIGTVTELTAPTRFAKEQERIRKESEAKEENIATKRAETLSKTLSEAGFAALGDEEGLQDWAAAEENLTDIRERQFQRDPSKESYGALRKQREATRAAYNTIEEARREKARWQKEEAEAEAFDSVSDKIETHVNQQSALDDRLEAIKLIEAAKRLKDEGAIKSNRQLKSILYRLNNKEDE